MITSIMIMIIRFYDGCFETWDSLVLLNAIRRWALNTFLKLKMA